MNLRIHVNSWKGPHTPAIPGLEGTHCVCMCHTHTETCTKRIIEGFKDHRVVVNACLRKKDWRSVGESTTFSS